MNKELVTGVILAGGAGSRVSHRDKGLMLWQGKPLVAHVQAVLKPYVQTVIISCNRNSHHYRRYADALAHDRRSGYVGPLAGLEAISGLVTTEYVVLAPCDVPALPQDYVSLMIEPLAKNRTPATHISYAHDGIDAHYLCAALRTECLHSVSAFLDSGERKVQHWIEQQSHLVVDVSDLPLRFLNYNEPADFEQ